MSHVSTMVRRTSKGLRLLPVNPGVSLAYLRKLFLEAGVFPFFRTSPRLRKKFGDVVLEIDFGWLPEGEQHEKFIKRLYFELSFGLFEIEIAHAIKRFLRLGDVFIDVGASTGYFSALGAQKVGKTGQVHCFEPSPIMFSQLEKLPQLNPQYAIRINNSALGEEPSVISMEYAEFPNIGGTSLVPGFMETHHTAAAGRAEVPVVRLDSYLEKHGIHPRLIKMDVEGFEFPVLKGLRDYFERQKRRPIIICEIQTTAYSMMGTTLEEFAAYMRRYGYAAYDIWNPNAEIDITRVKKDLGFNVVWKAPGSPS